MGVGHDGKKTQNFPHLETVETVLGSKFPFEQGDQAFLTPEDTSRQSVFVKAHEITLDAIRHHTGKCVNGSKAQRLTPDELLQVAHDPAVSYLSRRVAMGITMLDSTRDVTPKDADVDTPRAYFHANLTLPLIEHELTLPSELTYDPEAPLQGVEDGMVVIAPTGSGKTAIEAAIVRRAGIGLPRVGLHETDQLRRALVVVSTEKLVDQFAGVSGDDTFRRFIGDQISVTRFFGKAKDPTGNVVVTTPRSLRHLQPTEFDLAIVDEAHSGLAPQMLAKLGQLGTQAYLFTATPAYNRLRDLRNYFRYIEEGDLRSFIEQGILNPTRLLTYMYENDPEKHAASLASAYIKAGRKVVVYSRPGEASNPSHQATTIAQWVNEMHGSVVAQAVGSHIRSSRDYEAAYTRGTLRLLTTCRRLREGWNEDVDVVICIGPHSSQVDLAQKVGRGLRIGKYITEVIELLPKDKLGQVSIWQLFGLDSINSGYIIAPDPTVEDPFIRHYAQGRSRFSKSHGFLPIEGLPQELRDNLITNKPVRSLVLQEGKGWLAEPTPGHVSITALAARFGVPVPWLQRYLDEQGFAYEGIRHANQRSDFERWYVPEAAEFLEKNPLPHVASSSEVGASDVAAICGISRDHVKTVAEELGIRILKRRWQKHRSATYFDFAGALAIIDYFDRVPIADETDVSVFDLEKETGARYVTNYCARPENNITPVDKRRHGTQGMRFFGAHVTAEEAAKIRESYFAQSHLATEDDISYTDIAREAGVSLRTVTASLTEEERLATYPRRKYESVKRPGSYLPRGMGEAIVERIKPQKLPPHLVPLPVIGHRLPRDKSALLKWLTKRGYTSESRYFFVRPANCYSWEALKAIEEHYGLADGVEPIDYARLVRNEHDTDEERWNYTQSIQAIYIKRQFLAMRPVPTSEVSHQPVSPPKPAASPPPAPSEETVIEVEVEPLGAPVGDAHRKPALKRSEGTGDVPAEVKKTPNSPPQKYASGKPIPADYIDLLGHLADNQAECDPKLLRLLAQRQRVTRLIPDQKGGTVWASPEDARLLEKAIKDCPTATSDLRTPEQLARMTNISGMTAAHIAHLTGQLSEVFVKGKVIPRRAWSTTGVPGKLTAHYNSGFAMQIAAIIQQLKASGRVGVLLRFGRIAPEWYTIPPVPSS